MDSNYCISSVVSFKLKFKCNQPIVRVVQNAPLHESISFQLLWTRVPFYCPRILLITPYCETH